MPIDVSNLVQTAKSIQTYDPKFFSSKLTGSGKNQGVLKQSQNPGNIQVEPSISPQHLSPRKRHYTNGGTTIHELPFSVITEKMWPHMTKYIPDNTTLTSRACIGNIPNNHLTQANYNIYLDMLAFSIIMDETQNKSGVGYNRRITPCYQIFLYFECDKTQSEYEYTSTSKILNNPIYQSKNLYTVMYTTKPKRDFENIRLNIERVGGYIDVVMMMDYMADFSLYDSICRQSEIWQTSCDKLIEQLLNNISHTQDTNTLNDTANMFIAMEQYPIPLDLYRPIYQSIARNFVPDTALILCKQNLNLLLNDTLFSLNNKKTKLSTIPNPTQPVPTKIPLSKAQLSAVTTNNPLVLVQSGAGSGKSTVILNRLAYMVNSGVKPDDITVISFTNAAADHIREEQSLVHSMTACAMINTIYTSNFPTHALNTMESLASTIKAVYSNPATDPKHKIAHRFADHITNMDNTRGATQESNPQTRLNNFIEHHLNDVLNILNELGQTTLELQIIICYQMIDKLTEPPESQTKYLIIDEVQDNSVFEFIYFLRYAEKHNASLFLVGDCSQTLYEFRASNPKALNTLEGSGVFETHQLDINYRSNQEILDFANITLSRIEANQYANIQLKANSLATVTEQSFTEKVQLEAYQCAKKGNQFNQILPNIIKSDLKAYLDDKLQKKEQVAFMAYPRVQVSIIEATLREMYPNANIVSIMSEKQKSTTLFTRFITGYWNEVHWAPTPDLDTIIANLITAKLPYLIRRINDAAQKAALNQVSKWRLNNADKIKSWSRQYQNGVITQAKLLENTMQNMIDFEVHTNAIAQLLASQRNNDRKNEQDIKSADFVMSTIHSAKGREFPHCVIIYKDSVDLSEPDKRAYYVALTRAMQSEFIIAYDTYDNPDIKGQYEMILNTLKQNQTTGSKP